MESTRFIGAWIHWSLLSILIGIPLWIFVAVALALIGGRELAEQFVTSEYGYVGPGLVASFFAYRRALTKSILKQLDSPPGSITTWKFGWLTLTLAWPALILTLEIVVTALSGPLSPNDDREQMIAILGEDGHIIFYLVVTVLALFTHFVLFRWSIRRFVLSPMFPEGAESSFVPQAGAASAAAKIPVAKVPRPFFAAWFAWTICALAVGAGLLFGADRFLAVPPDSPAEKLLLALVWIAATFPFYRWTLNRFARPVLFPDPALFPDAARPPFAKSAKGWGMCALVCIPANLALGELKWGVFGRFGETAVADAVVAAAALMISFAAFKWSAKKFVFALPSPPPEPSQPPEEPQ